MSNPNPISESEIKLIARLARRMHQHLPRRIDLGDLISDGYLGLHRARRNFDPSRKIAFGVFAIRHIRGAMLDGIRSRDWMSRRARQTAKNPPLMLPLEQDWICPETIFDPIDARDWVIGALPHLPRVKRLVLQLYYLHGLSMRQIGDCLDLTESRISQLHAETIENLREGLDERSKRAA